MKRGNLEGRENDLRNDLRNSSTFWEIGLFAFVVEIQKKKIGLSRHYDIDDNCDVLILHI